ncbi:g5951 [Coccomyxa viridis]|uniref:G5951 protein n=1 Tax=Coccomyxa viridis TaxID=1274662 RepID=A0ABP1FVI3_9CHLO
MPLQGRRLAAAAGYRRLFAEGEGEGEGSNIQSFGCFPDFYYPQDFDDWIQGHFKEPLYSAGSKINPAGIILWLLHGAGILSLAFV